MNDRAVVPAAAGGQIADEQELGAEHARLARYVAGVEATPYQISKYVDFHQRREVEPLNEFDAFLLRLSSWGRPGLALCDAYTGTLYRSSIVRVKLMITVAILECSPPSFVELDKPESNERWVFVSMFLRIALSAIALFVALLVIAPFHFFYAATGRAKKKRGSVVAPLT
jgi:hypothetical protein